MNSFDRFLQLYPEGYTKEERIQAYLWYYLRKNHKRTGTAHIRDVRELFLKADRIVPSDEEIRNALSDARRFPLGKRPDTHGMIASAFDWHDEKFELNGKRYDAGTHIPIMIYPNPLNPDRYIVLNSSFTFSEFSGGTNSLQIPKLPDWAVIDLSVPRSQRHPAAVVNAGFFDEHWQYKSH